jgi:ABC-type Na+ efflux pump permease subunit
VPFLKTFAEGFLVLRLLTLGATIFAAFRYMKTSDSRLALAWAALAAHLPMLFIFASAQFRYAMIAWDISAMVTLAVIADQLTGRHADQAGR